MTLTPDDIKRRQFGVARRGLDPDEVRRFLEEVAAALADAEARASAQARFGRVGEEVASLLAHAERSAEAIEESARATAAELEARAEATRIGAEELRAQAEQQLTEAERSAAAIFAEAQESARKLVEAAEDEARERAAEVLRAAQQRLDTLLGAEREVYDRLVTALGDVNRAVDRVAGPRDEHLRMTREDPVVDPIVEETWSRRTSPAGQRIVGSGPTRPPLRVLDLRESRVKMVVDLTDLPDEAEGGAPEDPARTEANPAEEAGSGGRGPEAELADRPPGAPPPTAAPTAGAPQAGERPPPQASAAAGPTDEGVDLRQMVQDTVGGALRSRPS